MNRRDVIELLAGVGLAWPLATQAQSTQRVHRIGVLTLNVAPMGLSQLRASLRDLGYEDGRNFLVDYRLAQGREDQLASFAVEMVASNVDLIIAPVNVDALAAKRATSTIPIVVVFSAAPDEIGLVASLRRPGGNVTGTTVQAPETAGKILQVLRETVPGLRRVTILWEPDFPGMALYRRETERAAVAMGIRLTLLPSSTIAEIETALDQTERDRPDGLYIVPTGAIGVHVKRVIEFAARRRLPAIYTDLRAIPQGGLISYAADITVLQRRTAAIIDKILKGTKPADIPVEQPTRYKLAVNLKTARALGITIPDTILLQAEEVIE